VLVRLCDVIDVRGLLEDGRGMVIREKRREKEALPGRGYLSNFGREVDVVRAFS
jgi:hypothetical protein